MSQKIRLIPNPRVAVRHSYPRVPLTTGAFLNLPRKLADHCSLRDLPALQSSYHASKSVYFAGKSFLASTLSASLRSACSASPLRKKGDDDGTCQDWVAYSQHNVAPHGHKRPVVTCRGVPRVERAQQSPQSRNLRTQVSRGAAVRWQSNFISNLQIGMD